jgi:hypothetical protein
MRLAPPMPLLNPLLSAPVVDMEEATRQAAQKVIELMQQQEQEEVNMRTATTRIMQGLLRLALTPQGEPGGGAQGEEGEEEEAPGADPMEVEAEV